MSKKAVAATPELSPNAVTVLERRYLKRDEKGKPTETPVDMFRRVADTIASAEDVLKTGNDSKQLSEELIKKYQDEQKKSSAA